MPDLTQEGLAARGLRVKALEWFDAPNICTREKAAALGGHYSVVEFDAGTDEAHFAVNIDLGGLAFVFILEPDPLGGRRPKRYPTIEAARAAAQADYAARILAALEDTGEPALIREAEARGAKNALRDFDKADWFWRTMDPDDNGDTPHEAVQRAMLGNFCVCEVASSFAGPTRYGFTAPVLDPESDDEEFIHFATYEEAMEAAKARAAAAALRKDEEAK